MVKMIRRAARARFPIAGALGLLVAAAAVARAQDPHPLAFKVVQLNCRFDFASDGQNRWANRVDLVAGLIHDAGATVACLQEDKRDQVDDLKRALPGWDFVGAGRDGGGSERCSVAFDRAAWRCAAHGDFWLSDTPEKVASNTWGTKYPHKVTWATLESLARPQKRPITFLSTHLDETPEAGEIRVKSAHVIRTWLAEHARGEDVVVCGDFNAGIEEPAHAVMVDPAPAPPLVDAFAAAKKADKLVGTVHRFTGKSEKKRDDWVLVGGRLQPLVVTVDKWNRDGRYPSDHFGVVAEIEAAPTR